MLKDNDQRVEQIRRRHAAFIEQYSPGPDWEPCNQMSLDRGWLLAHIAVLDTALAARQVWVDEYAKQTEAALQQRDEAWAEFDSLKAALAASRAEVEELVSAFKEKVEDFADEIARHHETGQRLTRAEEKLRDAERAIERKNAALARPCISCGYEPKIVKPATPPPVAPSGGAA